MKAHRIAFGAALGVGSCALGWLGCGGDDNAAATLFADAGTDATAVVADSSTADGGTRGDAFVLSPQCVPTTTAATPATTWTPPAGYPRPACTTAQIDAVITDCTNPSLDPTKCAADFSTNAACATCIFGADGGAGALLTTQPTVFFVNFPGCIAIETGDAGASSCATTQGILQTCENAACSACPVDHGGTGITQIEGCNASSQASGGPCATFASQVSCAGLPTAIANTCYEQPTDGFQGYAERVAAVFCGGASASPDGGGDAGTLVDASDDGG